MVLDQKSGRSTTTCSLVFSYHIHKVFEDRVQLYIIYTDFAKACDYINHILVSILVTEFGEPLLS